MHIIKLLISLSNCSVILLLVTDYHYFEIWLIYFPFPQERVVLKPSKNWWHLVSPEKHVKESLVHRSNQHSSHHQKEHRLYLQFIQITPPSKPSPLQPPKHPLPVYTTPGVIIIIIMLLRAATPPQKIMKGQNLMWLLWSYLPKVVQWPV